MSDTWLVQVSIPGMEETRWYTCFQTEDCEIAQFVAFGLRANETGPETVRVSRVVSASWLVTVSGARGLELAVAEIESGWPPPGGHAGTLSFDEVSEEVSALIMRWFAQSFHVPAELHLRRTWKEVREEIAAAGLSDDDLVGCIDISYLSPSRGPLSVRIEQETGAWFVSNSPREMVPRDIRPKTHEHRLPSLP